MVEASAVTFKLTQPSGICSPMVSSHSVHAAGEGRRGGCSVLGGSPASAVTRAVLILPAVVSGPNPSSILPAPNLFHYTPSSSTLSLSSPRPWDLSSGFMTGTLKARQGVEPFSPPKTLLVPAEKWLQMHFLASCFSFRN